MTPPISGKKLVLVGGLILVLAAASARIFAMFYLKDMATAPEIVPQTQPARSTGSDNGAW
ncbi:MAG: hypothetical protein ABSH22_03790 [Tepidisphaeraceae bacterium]